MNDEELLFKQVQMTTAATKNATVWVYRCSVYAYPWYTSVRKPFRPADLMCARTAGGPASCPMPAAQRLTAFTFRHARQVRTILDDPAYR